MTLYIMDITIKFENGWHGCEGQGNLLVIGKLRAHLHEPLITMTVRKGKHFNTILGQKQAYSSLSSELPLKRPLFESIFEIEREVNGIIETREHAVVIATGKSGSITQIEVFLSGCEKATSVTFLPGEETKS